jgi:hypothetical protein
MEQWLTLPMTALSAVLYRMGGSDRYDTKWRDAGCTACAVVVALLAGVRTPWLALSALLLFGALTTYWKRKGTDAMWWNWLFVGLGFALAWLPVAWSLGDWKSYAVLLIAGTLCVTLWSVLVDNVVWEECGRGALVALMPAAFMIRWP